MIHIEFRAMGTVVEAWCPDESAGRLLQDRFEHLEQICSRFRKGSELSGINGSNGGRMDVSETLAEVLRAGDQARALTGGLVDIGVGMGVTSWGYDRTFDLVTSLDQAPSKSTVPEWSLEGRTLTISAGTQLDLGGVAKGWACDSAIDEGLATVVSAGGDIRSVDSRTVVPVIDPWGVVAARISLGSGGLATSSTTRRRWKVGTREVCHIIDPRTMAPAETPILSATVIAETALAAEVGAKAVLLNGDDGLTWAAGADWITAAIVIWHDGSVYATPGTEVAA